MLSVMTLGLVVGWAAGALLAFTIVFYILVYTMWLKRSTPQNIVIGGAAGASPPMIGWAAVTGDISLGSIALFLIIFMWTPPHFWALALYRCKDYERVGVPMLPVVAGGDETGRQEARDHGMREGAASGRGRRARGANHAPRRARFPSA